MLPMRLNSTTSTKPSDDCSTLPARGHANICCSRACVRLQSIWWTSPHDAACRVQPMARAPGEVRTHDPSDGANLTYLPRGVTIAGDLIVLPIRSPTASLAARSGSADRWA